MRLENNIEKLWYPSSTLTYFLTKLVWPLHLVFLLIVTIKRYLYTSKVISSNKSLKPVVVVGNITVGGTGKTPFISELILILREQGISTGIVSRGYKARSLKHPYQVSKTDDVLDVGDEAFMQFRNLNVPVVIDPDRSRAVKFLTDNNQVDLIISDDGLQHYAMHRDLEFLMIDAAREFGNRMILPMGPLREPIKRLNSVDLVIANGESKSSYIDGSVTMEGSCFVNLKSGEKIKLDEFKNRKVNAIAGIGNPTRFFKTLSQFCDIARKKSFIDHHEYSPADFNSFSDEVVIMTEKDAVKCISFAKDNWYYLKISMRFKDSLKEQMLALIQNKLLPKKPISEVTCN